MSERPDKLTQDNLKEWFNLSEEFGLLYKDDRTTFTIYKGFKILIDDSGLYHIRDTRKTNYYSKVTKEDRELIEKLGFIKAVDTISYRLNKRRVSRTTKKIERFYDTKNILPKDSKKLETIEKMIDLNINRLFFYRFRVAQFEDKYNK